MPLPISAGHPVNAEETYEVDKARSVHEAWFHPPPLSCECVRCVLYWHRLSLRGRSRPRHELERSRRPSAIG